MPNPDIEGIATAAVMSYLGWLASTATTPAIAPARSSGRRVRGGSKGSGRANSMTPANRSDLAVRPPDAFSIPRSVPRNIQSQVIWDILKTEATLSSSTTIITENNFMFSLSQHPQASSWTALFDQWTIPQVSIAFQSQTPPGLTSAPVRFYTALDFDNVANINSIPALEDFSTASVLVLSPEAREVRSIKPCCKVNVSATGNGVDRMWIDSGAPTTAFNGIRSILSISTAAAFVNCTITVWFAFRNQI